MTFPFSSPTIAALIKAINQGYTKAKIGTLLLEVNADRWDPKAGPNKETRLQGALDAMRESGEEEASKSVLRLAATVLNEGAGDGPFSHEAGWFEPLRGALAADGWEYDAEKHQLVSTVPGITVATETTTLEKCLRALGNEEAAGHYRQALEAFGTGNWASANSQLRSLLESLLPSLAEIVAGKRPKDVQGAIDILQANDFLVEGENSALRGLWSLSQPRGSHPGLSSEPEARFRLMAVTAHCRFLLERLPN